MAVACDCFMAIITTKHAIREQYRAEFVEEVMKILRETKDMTTEEFAQYKSDRAQVSKAASKAREKGNVTEAKAEETESEPEAEEKADDASTENSNRRSSKMRGDTWRDGITVIYQLKTNFIWHINKTRS